jgi:hypothetical protein
MKLKKLLRESNWTYDLDNISDASVNIDSNDKKRKIDSFIKQLQQFGMTGKDIKNTISKIDTDPPTREYEDGSKEWRVNGRLHRENGPAFIHHDGTKEWYIDWQRHREDGPAIEWSDGSKEWYKNGKRHRENGPAIERNGGIKEWFINGIPHREDGPAFERADGYKEWWINGRRLSEKEFNEYLNNKSTLSESKKIKQMKQKVMSLLSETYLEIDDEDSDIEPVNSVNIDSNDKKRKIDSFIKQLQQFGITERDINKWIDYDNSYTDIWGDGTKGWRNEDGQLHSENDKPALIFKDGTKEWYYYDILHRLDGPAIEYENGDKVWVLYGKRMDKEQYEEELEKVKEKINFQNLYETFTDWEDFKLYNYFGTNYLRKFIRSKQGNGQDGPSTINMYLLQIKGEDHYSTALVMFEEQVQNNSNIKYFYFYKPTEYFWKLLLEQGIEYTTAINRMHDFYTFSPTDSTEIPNFVYMNEDIMEETYGNESDWNSNHYEVVYDKHHINVLIRGRDYDELDQVIMIDPINLRYKLDDNEKWIKLNKETIPPFLSNTFFNRVITDDILNGFKQRYGPKFALAPFFDEDHTLNVDNIQESREIQQMKQKVISLLRETYLEIDDEDLSSEPVNHVNTDSIDKKRKIDSFIKQLQQFGMIGDDIKNGLSKSAEELDLDPPTREYTDGTKEWYKEGKLHRENGPAIEWADGRKEWWINGELHREDGPAFESPDGHKEWWVKYQRHREDGPAYERTDGYKQWWINDKQLTEEQFNEYLNNKSTLSESRKVQQMKQNVMSLLSEAYLEIDDEGSSSQPVNPVDTDSNDKKRKIDSFIKQLQQFGMVNNDIRKLSKSVEDSDLDPPTREYEDGSKEWYKDGKLHRENGPAVESPDGYKQWYKEGKRHRENGPAIEWADGRKKWFKNGQIHREDGPAFESPDGHKEWWVKDQFHREDGPAYEPADGTKKWFKNGKRHREDGPAIEWSSGTKEWYINDKKLTEEQFNEYLKNKSTLSEATKYRKEKGENLPRWEEKLKKYKEYQRHDPINNNYYVHFADIEKVGINPTNVYNTPTGFYAYPINGISKFATDRQNIIIFKVKNPEKILDLKNYSIEHFQKDIQKLLQIFQNSLTREKINELIKDDFERERFETKSYGGCLWRITRILSKNQNNWTRILLSLGYDGVEDKKQYIIHPNEPRQAVFFRTPNLEIVDILKQPKKQLQESRKVQQMKQKVINELKKLTTNKSSLTESKKNYYSLEEFPGISIKEIIQKWSNNSSSLYDENVHGMFSPRELWNYREYTWSRDSASGQQVRGQNKQEYTDKWAFLPDEEDNTGSNKWDSFVNKMKESGWSKKEPLIFIVGRNGKGKVGEGNHRLAIALAIGLKSIPVRFIFNENVELDSASNR